MSETVKINGIIYDANTGLPVSNSRLAPSVVGDRVVLKKQQSPKVGSQKTPSKRPKVARTPAMARIKKPQKSITLGRRYVSRPTSKVQVINKPAVTKHPEVSHFNSKPLSTMAGSSGRPVVKPIVRQLSTSRNLVQDIRRPVAGAVVKKTSLNAQSKKALPLEEVDHVFSEVARSIEKEVKKDVRRIRRSPKSFYIITGVIVVILVAAILAVFSLPQIEMMIASRYAGVDGRIPSYIVPGYRINGSINYASGQVKIAYWNDRQNEKYIVVESKTDQPDQELAISHGSAVFIRGGVRYYLTYSSLSDEQVRRIIASL
jgi:hypothetical protein